MLSHSSFRGVLREGTEKSISLMWTTYNNIQQFCSLSFQNVNTKQAIDNFFVFTYHYKVNISCTVWLRKSDTFAFRSSRSKPYSNCSIHAATGFLLKNKGFIYGTKVVHQPLSQPKQQKDLFSPFAIPR